MKQELKQMLIVCYSLLGSRDADDIFKVVTSKVQVTDHISENALLQRRHTGFT